MVLWHQVTSIFLSYCLSGPLGQMNHDTVVAGSKMLPQPVVMRNGMLTNRFNLRKRNTNKDPK